MRGLIFDFLVGRYAGITSGVLGIFGSLSLAGPPIVSGKVRKALIQLENISNSMPQPAMTAAKARLNREVKRQLRSEKKWNLAGALLLVAAFALLFINSVYCGVMPAGTCQ